VGLDEPLTWGDSVKGKMEMVIKQSDPNFAFIFLKNHLENHARGVNCRLIARVKFRVFDKFQHTQCGKAVNAIRFRFGAVNIVPTT
jgi:hypothetical protein